MRIVQEVSAGGVILRSGPWGPEVVLIARGPVFRWSLPKGHVEPGETTEQAAIREAQEETGLQLRLVCPLGDVQYWFSSRAARHHKTVHYFLMKATGGDLNNHDGENDEAAWFPIEVGLAMMAFRNEVQMVRRALAAWPKEHGAAASRL